MNNNVLIGLLIPFLGTILGSSFVFFIKNKMNSKLEKILLGFASGVMIAASVWSLLIPSLDMSEGKMKYSFIPASVGFVMGMLFLLLLDYIIPHLHPKALEPEGIDNNLKNKLKRTTMLIFAVTLHNIPEGMAVGVMYAGYLNGNSSITLFGAMSLAIGIAIQNIPEGAIVSMPLKAENKSRFKAFIYGSLSGIVEPIFGFLAIILVNQVSGILPYMLSFAAGAMIYVVVDELIPSSQEGKHSNLGIIGVMIGFTLMMILDVALG